jgi:hypothetical protein
VERADLGLVVVDADLDRELREGEPDWRSTENDVDPDDAHTTADVLAPLPRPARFSGTPSRRGAGGGATRSTTDSDAESGALNANVRDDSASDDLDAAVAASSNLSVTSPRAPSVETGVGDVALEVGSLGAVGVNAAESPSEPVVCFPERWREKEARVAARSLYSHLPGWRLMPVIVKANDDLRQEQFVSQLLAQFAAIFRLAQVPVWLKAYDILAVSPSAGLIQVIPDTISLDSLKTAPGYTTLDEWFSMHFNWGPRGVDRVRVARLNFARSLAAYSIICYLLQIKDRHNGNILVDRRGTSRVRAP